MSQSSSHLSSSPVRTTRRTAREASESSFGGAILLAFILPILPALQTHQSSSEARGALLAGCAALALLGLFGYFRGIRHVFAERTIVPFLVGSTGGLYVALLLWNVVFLRANTGDGYSGDIFRSAFRTFRSPIYGLPEVPSVIGVLGIGLPVLMFGALLAWISVRRPASLRKFALLICTFQLVMIGSFALTQSTERLIGAERDYVSFALPQDLEQFDSLPAVFSEWNETMSDLNLRNRHYPPGSLFMMKLERAVGLDGLFRAVVVLSTLATTLLMVPLARVMDLSERGERLAMLLLATSTGPLVFPTSFVAPLTMFFAAGIFVSFLTAVRARSVRHALLAGFLLGSCALFSFVVVTIGVVLAALLVVGVVMNRHSLREASLAAAQTVGGMTVTLVLVRLLLGFDVVECLSIARENAQGLMAADPFDDLGRYLLRSTANVLAYSVYTGTVLSGLAIAALRRQTPPRLRAVALATVSSLLLSGFAGQFWLETERIWVFFTPLLAVLAAGVLTTSVDGRESDEAAVSANNLLTSSVQELWHLHYV